VSSDRAKLCPRRRCRIEVSSFVEKVEGGHGTIPAQEET